MVADERPLSTDLTRCQREITGNEDSGLIAFTEAAYTV
jgi:hypothetical protein